MYHIRRALILASIIIIVSILTTHTIAWPSLYPSSIHAQPRTPRPNNTTHNNTSTAGLRPINPLFRKRDMAPIFNQAISFPIDTAHINQLSHSFTCSRDGATCPKVVMNPLARTSNGSGVGGGLDISSLALRLPKHVPLNITHQVHPFELNLNRLNVTSVMVGGALKREYFETTEKNTTTFPSFHLTLDNINATVTSEFYFWMPSFPLLQDSGHVDVVLDDAMIDFTLQKVNFTEVWPRLRREHFIDDESFLDACSRTRKNSKPCEMSDLGVNLPVVYDIDLEIPPTHPGLTSEGEKRYEAMISRKMLAEWVEGGAGKRMKKWVNFHREIVMLSQHYFLVTTRVLSSNVKVHTSHTLLAPIYNLVLKSVGIEESIDNALSSTITESIAQHLSPYYYSALRFQDELQAKLDRQLADLIMGRMGGGNGGRTPTASTAAGTGSGFENLANIGNGNGLGAFFGNIGGSSGGSSSSSPSSSGNSGSSSSSSGNSGSTGLGGIFGDGLDNLFSRAGAGRSTPTTTGSTTTHGSPSPSHNRPRRNGAFPPRSSPSSTSSARLGAGGNDHSNHRNNRNHNHHNGLPSLDHNPSTHHRRSSPMSSRPNGNGNRRNYSHNAPLGPEFDSPNPIPSGDMVTMGSRDGMSADESNFITPSLPNGSLITPTNNHHNNIHNGNWVNNMNTGHRNNNHGNNNGNFGPDYHTWPSYQPYFNPHLTFF